MKLTGWYQGDQKPVRVGVYLRDYEDGDHWYSYWNGKYFSVADDRLDCVESTKDWKSIQQNLPWRGVAK